MITAIAHRAISWLGTLGLIHMNGRVQDPVIGKLLSADPFITEPGFTQNYNRHSYVYNNPLSLVDPDGFNPECTVDFGAIQMQVDEVFGTNVTINTYRDGQVVSSQTNGWAISLSWSAKSVPVTCANMPTMTSGGNPGGGGVPFDPRYPAVEPTSEVASSETSDRECHPTALAIGNWLVDFSDDMGDVSVALIGAGAGIALVNNVWDLPGTAIGAATMGAGGFAGEAASAVQFAGGLMQWAGGASQGKHNMITPAVTLGTGQMIKRFFAPSAKGASRVQRDIRTRQRLGQASAGGLWDAVSNVLESKKDLGCDNPSK